jgi:hypothetical protein
LGGRDLNRAEVLEVVGQLPLPDLRCPGYPPKRSGKMPWEIPALQVSDVQFGKRTPSYNSDVARRRLFELAVNAGKVINDRKKFARIEKLDLYFMGDIVEGQNIFKGQSYHVDSTVYAQAVHGASAALARLALRLLRHVDSIDIWCVRGNHGNDEPGSPVNWDEVCYEVCKRDLLGGADLFPERKKLQSRIRFHEVGRWYQVARVFGWGNLLVHGDQISGALGGTGFKTKVAGWIDAIPEPWDYLFLGHFHQYSSWTVNRRVVLVNGTTETDNEYAQEDFAATGFPMQRLAFFNEKVGLCADCPVHLEPRKPNR